MYLLHSLPVNGAMIIIVTDQVNREGKKKLIDVFQLYGSHLTKNGLGRGHRLQMETCLEVPDVLHTYFSIRLHPHSVNML